MDKLNNSPPPPAAKALSEGGSASSFCSIKAAIQTAVLALVLLAPAPAYSENSPFIFTPASRVGFSGMSAAEVESFWRQYPATRPPELTESAAARFAFETFVPSKLRQGMEKALRRFRLSGEIHFSGGEKALAKEVPTVAPESGAIRSAATTAEKPPTVRWRLAPNSVDSLRLRLSWENADGGAGFQGTVDAEKAKIELFFKTAF